MLPSELLERATSRDLTELMAYYEMEPFGAWRGDLAAGIVASTIANVYRKKGAPAFKPEDFMPKFRGLEDGPKKQSVEEMKKALLSIAAVHGAADRGNKKTPQQRQRQLKKEKRRGN